jgi:hypothetical protein
MSYSDFTLKKIKQELAVELVENQDLFSQSAPVQVSDYLLSTLAYNLPLVMAISTEKVRSELIIAQVLLEVRRQLNNKISFFSGIVFDVDKEKDLSGFCDFILSQSGEQFYLNSPVVAVVEAKNESITGGLGQCIAEMYAASLFNEREGNFLPVIYGAVTTGKGGDLIGC